MFMKKILAILMILFALLVVMTACMRENTVCDYNGYCSDNETDNCKDCENVMGRGIDVPPSAQTETSETGP